MTTLIFSAPVDGCYTVLVGPLARLRTQGAHPCLTCELREVARAFDALRQRDSAIVYYERYVSSPSRVVDLLDPPRSWVGFDR